MACDNEERCPFGDIIAQMSLTVAAANGYLVRLMARKDMKGLVPSHGDVLLCLFNDGPLPMAEIAHRIGRDPSTVTALVRKLIDHGYVEKVKSSEDRRVTMVRLTPAGEGLKGSMIEVSRELIGTGLAGIDEDDLRRTYDTLRAIRGNFASAEDKDAPSAR